MNEVDRCHRCGGSGTRVEIRTVGKLPSGQSFGDYLDGPCFGCGGRGTLTIVESLARALDRGNTFAWCMVHAQNGDPLPAEWAAGVHHGPITAVMRGYPFGTIADSYWMKEPGPTLEQVLAWEKARRDRGR